MKTEFNLSTVHSRIQPECVFSRPNAVGGDTVGSAAAETRTEEDVATYKAPDPRVPNSFRVRKSIQSKAKRLVTAWQEKARLNGDDPDEIDLSYVAERCLEVGLDNAWAELGGYPEDDQQMAQLFAVMKKNAPKR